MERSALRQVREASPKVGNIHLHSVVRQQRLPCGNLSCYFYKKMLMCMFMKDA
jgi:hypothetical protein